MKEEIRPLTPQETCAMYHYHDEYAALGIGAIAYYKGLSVRDKRFIDDMTAAILNAAQQSAQADETEEIDPVAQALRNLGDAIAPPRR